MTVAALLEQINILDLGVTPIAMLVIVFCCGFLGWTSWRSYITTLQRAERYGESSTCPQCRAYARFKILATGMDSEPGPAALEVAPLEYAWLRVECRKCGAVWRMPE